MVIFIIRTSRRVRHGAAYYSVLSVHILPVVYILVGL